MLTVKQTLLALAALVALAAGAAPAAAQNVHGALAISNSTGDYGYGFNYPSARAAQQRAMSECANQAKKAKDCRVYATFQRACISIAAGTNVVFGWAIGGPNDERPERALNECASANGNACRIVQQFCSTGQ